MNLLIVSDLHNEERYYHPPRPQMDFDAVVLAGDIGGVRMRSNDPITWARSMWPDKTIIYIAGNHEFYHADLEAHTDHLRKLARLSDIHFLENDSVCIGGVRFIGATLWSDFNLYQNPKKSMREAGFKINDFRLIRRLGRPFSPKEALQLFTGSRQFLASELAEPFKGDSVVITHFGPSQYSITPKWAGSKLSPYFSSDLSDLMGPATLWIHGHTHDSVDYLINGTRIISNPHGYPVQLSSENVLFDSNLVVDTARCERSNADLKNLMLHRFVKAELYRHPEKLNLMKGNLWRKDYFGLLNWEVVLSFDFNTLATLLVEMTDRGFLLRNDSPIEGVLSQETMDYVSRMYQGLADG